MEEMKIYTHEEMLDRVLGPKGTKARDKHEDNINAFLMGETIKKARKSRHLTQEQLGELIGVKRSQVSKMENGKSLSFGSLARAFRAMGISASLNVAGFGQVAL